MHVSLVRKLSFCCSNCSFAVVGGGVDKYLLLVDYIKDAEIRLFPTFNSMSINYSVL